MEQAKIIVALIVAVLLQWTLRNVYEPLTFVDFPLIIVVYAALQGSSIKSLLYGTLAGLAMDGVSGGLLGANGFSKTLVAFVVSEIVRRVYVDNLLLRIPVIAGACLLDDLVYYGMHRLLGQQPTAQFITTIAYSLIGTTIAGTVIFLLFSTVFTENVRRGKRDTFTPRRQTRRRNPIRLGSRR